MLLVLDMVKTKKGVISTVIMGFILIIGLIVFMIIPVFVSKVSITRTVKTEYDWNNADSALLGLLSHEDVRNQINLYVYDNMDDFDESEVRELLDKLVITGCYELSYSTTTRDGVIVPASDDIIIDGESCTPNRLAKTFIAAPYGQPPAKIMLKIKQ